MYKIECTKGNIAINAHWHKEMEILYTTCDGIIELDTEVISFEKNSVIFINKEQLHLVNPLSDGQIFAIVFDFGFLDFKNDDICQVKIIDNLNNKNFLFPKFMDLSIGLREEIIKIMKNTITLYDSDTLGRELKIKSNLYELIFLLYTNKEFIIPESSSTYHNIPQLSYVKDTIVFMENNYATPITIEDLERNINISKYYLIKLFKQITGETPIVYLRNLRIDISKDFLAQGFSVTETALMSGFNNVSYYIRHFKEINHVSPKEYRKTILSN